MRALTIQYVLRTPCGWSSARFFGNFWESTQGKILNQSFKFHLCTIICINCPKTGYFTALKVSKIDGKETTYVDHFLLNYINHELCLQLWVSFRIIFAWNIVNELKLKKSSNAFELLVDCSVYYTILMEAFVHTWAEYHKSIYLIEVHNMY